MGVGKHRQWLRKDMNLKCWLGLKDGFQPMAILDQLFRKKVF